MSPRGVIRPGSRLFGGSLCALALIAGPGAASAQAHASQILIGASTLVYEQRPAFDVSLDNNVSIALGSDSLGAYYEIADPGSTGIYFPSQCTPLDEGDEDVRCPAAGIDSLYVRLGTGTVMIATTDNVLITAPTPAIVSGGSVTNAGGPRTSNITVGPVGGNVIYGNPGTGRLDALNGFPDTIHSCPGNLVEADPADTVLADCAPPPEAPVKEAPPTPIPVHGGPTSGTTTGTTPTPGTSSTGTIVTTSTTAPRAHTQSEAIVLTYKRAQPILGRRVVTFGVSVAKPLIVVAHGRIVLPGRAGTIPLGSAQVRIARKEVLTAMALHVPRRMLARLRSAFRRHPHLDATVQIEATDPSTGIEYLLSRLIPLEA
jgi:hypothetical protein